MILSPDQNYMKQGDLGKSLDLITHAIIASLHKQELPLEMRRKTACLQYISSGDR